MSFSPQLKLEIIHWSLSDSKNSRVSRTLLSILTDVNKAVIWIFSFLHLISNSSNLFTKPLKIVPSTLTIIGITVTVMFYTFVISKSKYLSFFLLYFIFTWLFAKIAKSSRWQVFFSFFFFFCFFFLLNTRSGLQIRIRRSVCISKS